MAIKDYIIANINASALPERAFDIVKTIMTDKAILTWNILSILVPLALFFIIGIFSKQFIHGKKRRFITVKNYWYLLIPHIVYIIFVILKTFPMHYMLFE